MSAVWKRALSLLLMLGLLLPFAVFAFADEEAEGEPEAPRTPWVVRVYFDGLLTCRGYGTEEGVYLAPADLCRVFGLEAETDWDEETGELSVTARGFALSARLEDDYYCVNQRYLYEPEHFLVLDGKAWFPMENMLRVFGLSGELSDDELRLDVDSGAAEILKGSDTYYTDTFGSDEVFWMARIIRSEAGHQSLAGRIGVGAVILNRVADERYPDTVYDVIFDTEFNIQFEPTTNGTLYIEPSELDMVAACLCFEGYNTVGESLFFIDPYGADDSWLKLRKTFVIRIDGHDFYA